MIFSKMLFSWLSKTPTQLSLSSKVKVKVKLLTVLKFI